MYSFRFDTLGYVDPLEEYELTDKLEKYIVEEIQDSLQYQTLSKWAPSEFSKELLAQLECEEKNHAYNFMKAYSILTGKAFKIPEIKHSGSSDYIELLRQRLMDETDDYRTFGDEYIKTKNAYLKELFFNTSCVEVQHAIKISLLLNEK